jgi:hypothetical protein
MQEPIRPRLSQAEQTGLPPSHRVLLFRQFLQATWIFLRFGLGEDVDDRGVASLLDAEPRAEGGDGRSIAQNASVRNQLGKHEGACPRFTVGERPA